MQLNKATNLAAWLCTRGGNCLWSPTKTKRFARYNGPRHTSWPICEASSTMQTSNFLLESSLLFAPRQVVATTGWKKEIKDIKQGIVLWFIAVQVTKRFVRFTSITFSVGFALFLLGSAMLISCCFLHISLIPECKNFSLTLFCRYLLFSL